MYNQLLLSARIGDGCFYRRNVNQNYILSFVQKQLDYIQHKRGILDKLGIKVYPLKKMYSGYKQGAFCYAFHTSVSARYKEYAEMPITEVINNLDKLGLIYYFLDDGSYHKSHGTLHLYCSSFTENEALALIDRIYTLYPKKRCSLYWDKKRCGKVFPYVYVPRKVAEVFLKDVESFLEECGVSSLLYKIGSPSQTNESIES